MKVWIVTTQAQEQDKFGTVLRVDVRSFGVYTTPERARQIAAKYAGSVLEADTDSETCYQLEHWVNPGFAR